MINVFSNGLIELETTGVLILMVMVVWDAVLKSISELVQISEFLRRKSNELKLKLALACLHMIRWKRLMNGVIQIVIAMFLFAQEIYVIAFENS